MLYYTCNRIYRINKKNSNFDNMEITFLTLLVISNIKLKKKKIAHTDFSYEDILKNNYYIHSEIMNNNYCFLKLTLAKSYAYLKILLNINGSLKLNLRESNLLCNFLTESHLE